MDDTGKGIGYFIGYVVAFVLLMLAIGWGIQMSFNGFNEVLGAPELSYGNALSVALFIFWVGLAFNFTRNSRDTKATVVTNNTYRKN